MKELTARQAASRIHAWIVEGSEGVSTNAIAEHMGVRWNTADDWIKGRSTPGGLNLIRLSRFLDHPLARLDEA